MKAKIFSDQLSVDSRLNQLGLSRDVFRNVMQTMKMAWNSTTENYPNGSSGILSWMLGTNKIREQLLKAGWQRDTLGNVSWVLNPSMGIRIAILNADDAVCALDRFPQPRSRKGAATESAISSNQQFLAEILSSSLNEALSEENSAQWYFCCFCDGEQVRGELSLPTGFSNGYFTRFAERIFVGTDDGSNPSDKVRKHTPDTGTDFEIPVIRKKAM